MSALEANFGLSAEFFTLGLSRLRLLKNQLLRESDEGSCLVFIPGWGGSLEMWQLQWNYFKDLYPCLVLDYPGFGQSSLSQAEKAWSVADQAELVAALLRDQGISSCVLVGHSIGGALSLAVAATMPQCVKAVIAAESLTYMDLYPAASEELVQGFSESFKQDLPRSVQTLLDDYFIAQSLPEHIEMVQKTMCSVDVATGVLVLEQFLRWDLAEQLTKVEQPVFTISAADRYLPETFEPQFAGKVAVTTLEHCGHFIMLDAPLAFNEQLLRLLDGAGY